MNALRFFYFHIRRLVKEPSSLISMVLLPACIVSLFIFLDANQQASSANQDSPTATVILLAEGNEDLGKLLDEQEFNVKPLTYQAKAIKQVQRGMAGVVYVIPAHYSKILQEGHPSAIQVFRRDKATQSQLFEQLLRDWVAKQSLTGQLKAKKLNPNMIEQPLKTQVKVIEQGKEVGDKQGLSQVVLLLVYILLSGIVVGVDLVTFKKDGSLRRSLVSALPGWQLTLAFLLANASFMLLVNALFLGVLAVYYAFPLAYMGQALTLILLAILFSCSLGLVLFRLFKDPQLCMSLGTLVWLLILGLAFISQKEALGIWHQLGFLSPFAWMVQILDRGQYFPGVLIILLMTGALFTAGSLQLEKYVQE
ncbi:ABC transporter permease [Vaginisenegalia massiliensis]|uniref:ABC transporter permease n=1 Tax=Vaginisenegalia massiliensis TaxID=2058294 RepID=UPI000F52F2EC|nr:ABC transporter permease [Vaginisenegalia massiliensis]